MRGSQKRLCRVGAKLRNAAGGAVGALAGPAWADSSAHAHPQGWRPVLLTPFPVGWEHRFRISHDFSSPSDPALLSVKGTSTTGLSGGAESPWAKN